MGGGAGCGGSVISIASSTELPSYYALILVFFHRTVDRTVANEVIGVNDDGLLSRVGTETTGREGRGWGVQ